eukprot:XP_016664522.1 PREDICTED: uncharacterized protein LOC107885397 [Acyrthosiphon pisum]
MEKSLLNESDCLTSQMLNSNVFDEMDDPSEHDNEKDNIESSSGRASKSSVPKECFDLLTEFEMENSEPFNELERDCAQYVAGYVANRFANKYPELIKQIDDKTISCWTSFKSKGGLKLPSDNMMVAVRKLEYREYLKTYLLENSENMTNICLYCSWNSDKHRCQPDDEYVEWVSCSRCCRWIAINCILYIYK